MSIESINESTNNYALFKTITWPPDNHSILTAFHI